MKKSSEANILVIKSKVFLYNNYSKHSLRIKNQQQLLPDIVFFCYTAEMLQHILSMQRLHRKIKGHSFYLLCAFSGCTHFSRELNPDAATLSTEANQDMRVEEAVKKGLIHVSRMCACSKFHSFSLSLPHAKYSKFALPTDRLWHHFGLFLLPRPRNMHLKYIPSTKMFHSFRQVPCSLSRKER